MAVAKFGDGRVGLDMHQAGGAGSNAPPRVDGRFGAVTVGAILSMLLACGSAHGQGSSPTAPAGAATNTAPEASMQEVVVTARHRSEDLQKTPAAVSVLGGDFLEQTNTTQISQITQYVPSLQFIYQNARNSNINIRGLGSNIGLANDGLNSGVGFYVDQVFYTRPASATLDLIDIDQIEVLRGPQGTLFGKDTTAGAIAITTAEPTFHPSGLFEVTGGDYSYFQGKASVSGPLVSDVLAGRLTVGITTRDGLSTNIYDDQKVNNYRDLTLRGQFLYKPVDALKIRVIGDYESQRLSCCAGVLSGIVSPPNGKSFPAYAEAFGYTPVVDPFARQVDVNSPFSTKVETGGGSLEMDYATPKAVFTSISAWRFMNFIPVNDADASPLSILLAAGAKDYENQTTQEFRVASAGENRIDYVTGVYLYHEQLTADAHTLYGPQASYFLLGPKAPANVVDGLTANSTSDYHTNSAAVFGQGTWHVTPRLNLTGGLRYTFEHKRGDFEQTVSGGAPLTGAEALFAAYRAAIATPTAFGLQSHESKPSGTVSAAYQFTPTLLGYTTYAHGSKSGGLNLQQLPQAARLVVQPESLNSVEVGAKTSWLQRRVTLDVDGFWERDDDYQANNYDANVNKVYLSNIPEVRSEGVEVDLRARPTIDLTLYTSATLDRATYVNYPQAPCPLEQVTRPYCNLDGRPLAGVPHWAVSAGGEYSRSVTIGWPGARAYFGLDYSYRSSLYSQPTDSIYSRLAPLTLVNIRTGVRKDHLDVYVWVKNLLDRNYFTIISPGIGNTGALYAQLGDPRTWGAAARYRF